MREVDEEILAREYDEAEGHPDIWLRERLGVSCSNVNTLAEEVLADFDEHRFGIGWWAPEPGTRRRILIADCLYQAIAGLHDNLVEAKLHLLELADCHEQLNCVMENAVSGNPRNGVRVKHPRPRRPLDQLPKRFATLHVVGITRALNSVLDCMAAAIVGIAGVPTPIQGAGYGGVLRYLRDPRNNLHPAQQELREAILRHERNAGPDGWCKWVRAFRNMAVHRGRRLVVSHLVQRTPLLLDARGAVIVRADTVPVLPSEPGWSDIQAMLGSRDAQLSEPAETTLGGAMTAIRHLANQTAADLVTLWKHRRKNPGLLRQPRAQWPDVRSRPTSFEGFAPGTAPSTMDTMTGHDSVLVRFKAAALDDANRHRWDTEFD